jgi:hypothetical protein
MKTRSEIIGELADVLAMLQTGQPCSSQVQTDGYRLHAAVILASVWPAVRELELHNAGTNLLASESEEVRRWGTWLKDRGKRADGETTDVHAAVLSESVTAAIEQIKAKLGDREQRTGDPVKGGQILGEVHGWTTHGHACCHRLPMSAEVDRPLMINRCGGPAICSTCATQAAQFHAIGGQ